MLDDLNPVIRGGANDEGRDRTLLKIRISAWLSKKCDAIDTGDVAQRILKSFDDKGEVLDLSDLALSSLPDFLDEFYWVKTLVLSGNGLAEFPDCICRMVQLESLNLARNKIKVIPLDIINLKKLNCLDLTGNANLYLPRVLETQVVEKNLLIRGEGSEVEDVLSDWDNKRLKFHMGQLNLWIKKGKVFDHRGCRMALRIALKFRSEEIDLSGMGLTEVPPVLTDMFFLKKINLSANPIGKFPGRILVLKNLEELSLSQCKLTSIPDDILLLERLVKLNLSVNDISSLPENMTSLNSLIVLNVEGNRLLSFPKGMDKLMQLRRLYCDFSGRGESISEVPAGVNVLVGSYENSRVRDFSLGARRAFLENARCFTVGNKDARVLMMGSKFPSPVIDSADFMSREFGRFFVLLEKEDEQVKNYLEMIDKANSSLESMGDHDKFSKCSTFEPIEDFFIPTLKQFVCLSEEVKESVSKGENFMVCCGYGGGRTGTMLACIKLLYRFLEMGKESKNEMPDMNRVHHVNDFYGNFSKLSDEHKTTDFVRASVEDLRKSEELLPSGAVSVETPDQFLTLELWHLLLSINHKVKVDKEVSDDQIKEWIVDAGFSDDFLERFGKNNETGEGGKALSGLDYIVRTTRSLQL